MITGKRGLKDVELLAAGFQAEIYFNLRKKFEAQNMVEKYSVSATHSKNIKAKYKILRIQLGLADDAGDLEKSVALIKN